MSKAKIGAGLSAAALVLAAPLIMRFEGLSLTPYADPIGLNTVCWGETNVQMRRYTLAECRLMLADSMAAHGVAIAPCLPENLPDHVQAAMLSFGYNVGAAKFCASTMARKLQAGDITGACNELPKWIYAGGQVLRGLVTRREAERRLCLGMS